MSQNIHQIFLSNPITTNTSTDLMYFGQSPYTTGNDAAMTYANFSAQFVSSALTSGHLYVGNVSNVATSVSLSGDATLANTGALTLANSGVTANSYTVNGSTLFTVDVKGRLTNASNIIITAAPSGSAGGDLSSTYPNPTVAKINGATLGTTTATSGNVLIGSGTTWVTNAIAGDAALTSAGSLTVSKIGGKAVSLAGSFTTSGANPLTFTTTGTTTLTLPLSGTVPSASSSLTSNGVIIGGGGSSIIATAAGPDGTVFVGSTGFQPSFANSVNGDFGISCSTSGVDRTFSVFNSSNTASSSAHINVEVGGASAGDCYYMCNVVGATIWTFGAKNSDSDAWVLSASSSLGSSNTVRFDKTSLASTFSGDMTVTSASTGLTRSLTVSSTSNTASSGSVIQQTIAGTTASNCYHRWANTGVPEGYAMGLVPSTGNFQLSYAQTAGGTPSSDFISLILDKNQNFTYPRSTNFFTYFNTNPTNVTGDGTAYTLAFGASLWDYGSNISTTTFTATTTAKYFHQLNIGLSGLAAANTSYTINFVTSNRTYQVLDGNIGAMRDVGNNILLSCSLVADFDASDTATWTIAVSGSTKVVGVLGISGSTQRAWWTGHIVG